ncbi:MAG: hypothetical protein RLZZ488_1517 [Pseudomonadota bacterium]|jgi:shikimate 5-dehydrogenase
MDEKGVTSSTDGTTQLLVLLGKDLSRSPSPATHTQWAQIRKLNFHYNAMSTNSEAEFISLAESLMRSQHFAGGNITNPFKSAALKLDGVSVDAAALRCGAANTLYRREEFSTVSWHLTNTDLLGCSESIQKIMSSIGPDSSIVDLIVLGRGAMARTVLRAVEDFSALSGVEFDALIGGRDSLPIDPLPKFNLNSFRYFNLNDEALVTNVAENLPTNRHLLCINTLPGGTNTEAETTIHNTLRTLSNSGHWQQRKFFCVSYAEQTWHSTARQLGWDVINGDLLFEIQARAAFKLWTGVDAPNHPTALLRS